MDDATETPKEGALNKNVKILEGYDLGGGGVLVPRRMVEGARLVQKRSKVSHNYAMWGRREKSNHQGPPWETSRAVVGLTAATSHRNKQKSDVGSIPR